MMRSALTQIPVKRPCLLRVVSYIDTMNLSGKHRKTLQAVFAEPVRANVKWTDVEHLLRALGAEITEGRGSRIRIHLQGVRAVFHRPHSQPDMGKGALKSMRRFLEQVGVKLEAGDHAES